MLVESDAHGRFVSLRGNPAHGYSKGVLCGKTAIYGALLDAPERLRTPLVRVGTKPDGRLEPATWERALARIAERIAPLRGAGHRILASSYAGTMGRVQRFFPMRAMHALGATTTDGGLCDNSTTAGYECVLGEVYGADLEALEEHSALVLWGCDMVRTVQHLQPAVQRMCKRGVPVLALDIYRTDTFRALEAWGGRGLLLKPGTDAALALGLMRLCFERGYVNRAFLAERCVGGAAFEAHVLNAHDLAWTSATTGIAAHEIEALADLLGRSPRFLIKTGVGFGRRRNGAMSMRAVCSLASVLGKPEQIHYESAGCFQLANDVIERPDLRPADARRDVIQQVKTGRELASGRFGAVFVWGHNPAVVCPESRLVRAGLARPDVFTVVHEQFLTDTAQLADVVLPATMFPEHTDVYRSYGHRRLQWARRACNPPDGPRCNVDAFAAIARALELPRETWDATSESVAEEFVRASTAHWSASSVAALRRGDPVKVTPPGRAGQGTKSGKVELVSQAAHALGQPAMASYVPDDGAGTRGEFWLVCAPSVHTHNSTFAYSPRHVRRRGAHFVHMHPEDAGALGLEDGHEALLSNVHGALTLPVRITCDMPRGTLRVDGMPIASETREGVGINGLVSAEVSDMGDSNTLYSTRVDVRRAAR